MLSTISKLSTFIQFSIRFQPFSLKEEAEKRNHCKILNILRVKYNFKYYNVNFMESIKMFSKVKWTNIGGDESGLEKTTIWMLKVYLPISTECEDFLFTENYYCYSLATHSTGKRVSISLEINMLKGWNCSICQNVPHKIQTGKYWIALPRK